MVNIGQYHKQQKIRADKGKFGQVRTTAGVSSFLCNSRELYGFKEEGAVACGADGKVLELLVLCRSRNGQKLQFRASSSQRPEF